MNLFNEVEKYDTILVRLPNWVGDIVMCTPSLRNLKESFPQKKFVATGKSNIKDVLRSNGIFDEFLYKPGKDQGISAYVNYIQKIRQLGPSAGILYTNSVGTAMDFFLARVPLRLGYKNEMREFILTHSIPRNKEPMDKYYARLTRAFGAEIQSNDLEMGLDESCIKIFEIVERKYNIDSKEFIIGLNPGAGFGETKKWLSDYYVDLAKKILEVRSGVRFFVFGGPGDEDRADYISDEIGESAINLSKESLGLHNIKPFFHRMQLFVTNDSGLRWYSLSMKKPTVVLFGSSDPSLTNCFMENFYPLRNPVHCSPCKNRVCPTDFACMKGLTAGKVFHVVHEIAQKNNWAMS